jgi:hypothetical protein
MSVTDLETRELLGTIHDGVGHLLGLNPQPVQPMLLSRHWTVFQVPSASTPGFAYYVVGSVKDGFRCSCQGFQSSGGCYHSRTVTRALSEVKADRRNGKAKHQHQLRASAATRTPRSGGRFARGGTKTQKGKR